ncbi:ATP-binding protein [Crocinitomix catalasitica]|uniref:ATP-binding protein n=1 Tax=Crocinitomix catalasitica TaxID=184607 RepID=UPI00047F3A55|nr:ATP-binding protein [Crocinitomix catalasitica]
MKSRYAFEYKILAIIIVVITLVTMIGFYAYNRFSNIVGQVSEAVRPDINLVTAKDILNDLSDAENNVKSYSLTRDATYINKIDTIKKEVDQKLVQLQALIPAKKFSDFRLDSLKIYTDIKFEILNDILLLQPDFRVKAALKKVSTKIEEAPTIEDTLKVPIEIERRALFKKNKKELDTIVTIINRVNISDVNREIQTVEIEENHINRVHVRKELSLIAEDRIISRKIRAILDKLETSELNLIAEKTLLAKEAVKNTNLQIALFCCAIGVLLLILVFIIINYVKTNNTYKLALQKAKEKSELLATSKAEFLANMSHEIRTPMNALSGFAEQIALSELNPIQKEQINMIRKSSDHLLEVVNDVLDVSKLEQEKIILEKIGFSPQEVIEDVIAMSTAVAQQKSIALIVLIENDPLPFAKGDAHRLRQILLNLITNAIKFTPEHGTINIIAQAKINGNKTFKLVVNVKDTGIGMSQTQIANLFQAYQQGDVSTSREYGGTGLGLNITKKLIDLHNGSIHIESAINEGTNFKFELEYEITEVIDQVEPVKKGDQYNIQSSLQSKSILIADDEPFNCKLLTTIFSKYACETVVVTNGKDAIDMLEHRTFDLVLMDIRMPKMDGVTATEIIRSATDNPNQSIPIIGLTADITTNESYYLKIGFSKILTKPFKASDLLAHVFSILESDLPIQSTGEFTALKEMSADDDAFYVDMLETFMSSTTAGIKEIKLHARNKAWEEMSAAAHKIAPPCLHIEADALYEILKAIENNRRNGINLENVPRLIQKLEEISRPVLTNVSAEINFVKKK